MSAQRRSSKPSFLARLFCCVSPEQEAPTSSRPPAAPQGQQQVLLPARDEPAAAAGTQAARAGDAPAGTIAGQEGEEKKHSASLANDEDAVIGSREVGHESAASQAAVRPSEGDRVVSRPDDTIPPVGLAPALAQDAQGVAIISPDTSQTSSALLAEEKVALADDEPLTPSSASIAATVPIANTVDFSHSPQVGDDQQEFESWLLPPLSTLHHGKKCLVLDLDETLVHSSFKADFVVPVEIDGIFHNVYVIKRPGVDDFMQQMGEHFEIVVFTASLAKYADPVLDMLDIHKVVHHRLFRESCHNHMGNYVKDLSQLGRDLKDAIIIDNSPASYIFHPAHAVPISSWFNDVHDTELTDLIPFLIDLTTVDDVSQVLDLSI